MHALDGKESGRHLFRFVVIADTHCNEEEDRSASPYAVNACANKRARHVIAEVNRLKPAFVLHLGDIVHPVPELPTFDHAVRQFKALARELEAPLHVIPGNHDVGDKPVAWMPAGTVEARFVERYRELFGDDYYSFDAQGCHFVMIDAQIINSGLPREREQRAWLEADLRRHASRRTFIGIHYPPYVSDRHEAGSYDNIDEPGRSWLLALIERHAPEAVFCGHVHNFWYDHIGATECYLLPSTAFVRHDYSELYRVGPGDEQGRNEQDKLGYFVVEVHEYGHVAHFIRTWGEEREPGATRVLQERLPPVHTKTNLVAPVGVDLRHPWQEVLEVAATGGVQEFERKKVRNDFPLMALWEMGVRKLRIPLHDLMHEYLRGRMRILRGLGHAFVVHHFGVPSPEQRETLLRARELVSALEIVLPAAGMAAAAPALAALRARAGFPIYLSKLRKHEDAQYDGSHFHHFINHGYVLAEREPLAALFGEPHIRAAADGIVIRVVRSRSPWDDVPAGCALAASLGIRTAFQVRLAADNPAEVLADDLDTANRVAETVLVALAHPDVDVIFDTFDDVDRGYFARNGLVDRRYNPRAAGRVYRHLHAALQGRPAPDCGERRTDQRGVTCRFTIEGKTGVLALPASAQIEAPTLDGGRGEWIDLVTGVRGSVTAGHPAVRL
jgi:3',5'-cyclic AMP phosphodiesterase CpdA